MSAALTSPPSLSSSAQGTSPLTYDETVKGLCYDPASQVTQILHQLQATGSQVNKAEYLYNNVGNRTSLTDRRGSQAFGYDNLDRLTSATHPLLATPQAFAYDAVGNRTTAGNVTNAGNQLTADATHSYQYDDNGNLTRKTLLATGNYTQYTYDAENRLTKVEDFVAGATTAAFTSTYRYDGLGRRIEKVANGQTKRYIYDGEDILLEYDGANALQARYTHGPGIDEPIAVTKGGNTFFYHQDGLGSVTDLTDSAGAMAKSYSYDAYGTIVDQAGTVDQPYTYTGREFDAESGLYYYRARYYDSTTGRFLQEDPIGIFGGTNNLYQYAGGNPISLVDPLGLETCLLTTVGPVGIRDHASIYTSRGDGGGAAIYDPAGAFSRANHAGSGDVVTGPAASIEKYKKFHQGQEVELTCKQTSQDEEEAIINKAMDLPSAGPGQCSSFSSTALGGQPSFPNVQPGTFWPGNLLRQIRSGP